MLASPLHSRCYWFVLVVQVRVVLGGLRSVPLSQRFFEHHLVGLGLGDVRFLSDHILPVAFAIFEGGVDFLRVVSDGRFGILAPAVGVGEHRGGERLDATAEDFEAKQLGELVGRDFAAVVPLTFLGGDVDERLTARLADEGERLHELAFALVLELVHRRRRVVVRVEDEHFHALNLRQQFHQVFFGFHIVYRFRFSTHLPLTRFGLG